MSNEISAAPFDYGSLGDKAESFVRQKTTEIRDRMGRAAQNVVEIGERLLAVKEALGHGQFGPWLATEFEWSDDTAQRMMNVASAFKNRNLRDLNIAPSALYLLASPSTPEEVREEVIAEAKEGKAIKHEEVKAKVQAVKAKRRKATATLPSADPLDEEGSSDAVSDDLPAADKPAPAEKASGPQTPQKSDPEPAEPWADFNAGIDEFVADLDDLEKRMRAHLGASAKAGMRLLSPFAFYYSYTGTIGAVRALSRYLSTNKPMRADPDEQPGYVSHGRAEALDNMRADAAKRAAKAAGRVA